MKCVILAGGFGTRLAPLTDTMPKPLMPVLNKPIISHIISHLRSHNLKDICVTLKHMPEQIINHLTSEGIGSYFIETDPLGTLGSTKNALEGHRLDGIVDGIAHAHSAHNAHSAALSPVLVISSDTLTNIDLTAMQASHVLSGADVSMAVREEQNVSQFGVVLCERGRVTAFQEKPRAGEEISNTINCGVYIINREVFNLVGTGFQDFAKNLFPLMLRKKMHINAFRHTGYWKDIGSASALHAANIQALNGDIVLKHGGLASGLNIINSVVPCNVFVPENVRVVDSVVFEGATINSHVFSSIVSPHCSVFIPQSNNIEAKPQEIPINYHL